MSDSIIVALIASAPGVVALLIAWIKERKKTQITSNTNQLTLLLENMQEERKLIAIERQGLKKDIQRLYREKRHQYEKLEALKTGLLTMPLFAANAPVATWVKDASGRRMNHNKEFENMSGMPLLKYATHTDEEMLSEALCVDKMPEPDASKLKKKLNVYHDNGAEQITELCSMVRRLCASSQCLT